MAKASKATMPEVLYVRKDEPSAAGEPVYYIAEPHLIDVIDGDGPTVVGVYRLEHQQAHRKVVEAAD